MTSARRSGTWTERWSIRPSSISRRGMKCVANWAGTSPAPTSPPPSAGAIRRSSHSCSATASRPSRLATWATGKKCFIALPRARASRCCPESPSWFRNSPPKAFARPSAAAHRANLELLLEKTGLHDSFAAVVGMEDTTRGKPDPQVFLVAAQKLVVEPRRCVVFEDAVAGVQAARAGGMRCIAVSFVGHHPEEALRKAGADRVVHTLADVSANQVVQLIG